MLKDITLGQYFPGNTIVHRLDPRTKLIAVVLYIAALFTANNWSATALVLLTLVFCVALSRIRPKALFKGLKPLIVIVILTAVLNLFYSDGNVICSFWVLRITDNGIRRAVLMVLRIILLVCGTFRSSKRPTRSFPRRRRAARILKAAVLSAARRRCCRSLCRCS